ncbi:MAG: hypothetical protein M3295_09010, partial [Chloroflexota bacterium]|nr:hypothetical protein [Chloroflexota bacterium]
LDRAQNEELVAGLLEGTLPVELRDRIVALADGNPLFTEELIRMLMDRGVLRYVDGAWRLARPVDEVEVPGSIQAVLAARLDALPAGEKRAAQDAAVVGRIFWDAVLTDLLRQDAGSIREVLRRLRVKELVVPRQPSALAGAAEFGFRHVLVRDVAYDSLPKRDRGAKHLAVARWAEAELGSRADELVELLATHYESALRYAEEFGGLAIDALRDLRQRTYEYARRAGNRARLLWQKEAGTRWMRLAWDQARRLDRPPRERAEVAREYLEASRGQESIDVAHGVAVEAISLLEGLPDADVDDLELEARLRALDGILLVTLHRFDEAEAVMEGGIGRLAGPPSPGRATLLARLGWAYWRGERVADAPDVLRRAIDEARESGDAEAERWAIHELGIALCFLARAPEGLPLLRESMRLAQAANDQQLLMRCYINLAAVSTANGAPPSDVLSILADGVALARRTMDREIEAWSLWNTAGTFWEMGRFDESRELTEQCLALSTAIGDESQMQSHLSGRAWDLAMTGRWDEARSVYANAFPAPPQEAQSLASYEVFMAWDRWQHDPEGATEQLAEALRTRVTVDRWLGAARLARMAMRVGSSSAMDVALAAADEIHEAAQIGPCRSVEREWVHALAGDPAVAASEVLAAADRFEELDLLLNASQALADAAVLHARAGLPATAEITRRARELHERLGIVPMLGPIPEERWIGSRAAAASVDR